MPVGCPSLHSGCGSCQPCVTAAPQGQALGLAHPYSLSGLDSSRVKGRPATDRQCSAAHQPCCASPGVPGTFYPAAASVAVTALPRLAVLRPAWSRVLAITCCRGQCTDEVYTCDTGVPSARHRDPPRLSLGRHGGRASEPSATREGGISPSRPHKPCSWSKSIW